MIPDRTLPGLAWSSRRSSEADERAEAAVGPVRPRAVRPGLAEEAHAAASPLDVPRGAQAHRQVCGSQVRLFRRQPARAADDAVLAFGRLN